MKVIFLLLVTVLMVQGEVLRVSRAHEQKGLGTEQMRYTTERGPMLYHVEKFAILTSKDVKSARVVPKKKGVIEVKLTPEGAKKLSAATKDADGTLRLAIVVENVLEGVPLVQSELKGTFWISGLDERDAEGLEELVKAMLEKEEEKEEVEEVEKEAKGEKKE